MQIDSFQVDRFLTRKYVPTFFQSEKTRYLSPNFKKKNCHLEEEKKTHRAGIKFGKTHYHHIPWLV